jgi:AAHS family 4-hydroxybenzoate transporter-like MFS transporter
MSLSGIFSGVAMAGAVSCMALLFKQFGSRQSAVPEVKDGQPVVH